MRLRKTSFKSLFTLIIFCVAIVTTSDAQKNRPKKEKKKSESSLKKDQSNKAEKQAKYKESRSRHDSIQDKKTRKRMKKTRNRSMVHAGKKKLPFYKRWFRRN